MRSAWETLTHGMVQGLGGLGQRGICLWRRCPRRLCGGMFLGLLLLVLIGWKGLPYGRAWRAWQRAQEELVRHHPTAAWNYLEECLRFWPRDPAVHLLAARAAWQKEDFAAAGQLLKEYADLPDHDPQAHALELALWQAALGNIDLVQERFQTMLEKNDPHSILILEALSAGCLRTYRHKEAMLFLNVWLQYAPEDPQAYYLRGRAWERPHAYDEAIRDYRRTVELDPSRDDARRRLITCLLEQGDFLAAGEQLDILRQHQPDDPAVAVGQAMVAHGLGRKEEAVALLDDVLTRHPDFVPALRGRAQLALQEGQGEQALAYIRRALKYSPYDRQSNYIYQQCLEKTGRTAEALLQKAKLARLEADILRYQDIYNKLMPRHPHDPKLHYELGTIFLRLGEEELGVRWLESALRLDPAFAPAQQALADYQRRKGNVAPNPLKE